MTLGSQFKNTYWQNPDTGGTTDYYVREDYRTAEEVNSKRDTNPQGMLFSPYAHTGLVQDPTVSSEDRTKAIKKSLSLTDPVDYARRAKLKGPAAEGHIAGFVESINETDTTMSDIGRTHAVLTGELGDRGHSSFRGGGIVVGVEQAYQKVPIKTVGYEPSNTPIFNEKFWKEGQYEKHNPDAAEYYQDIIATHKGKEHIRWRHPNGTIYTNDDLEKMTLGDLNLPIKNRSSSYVSRHEVEKGQHVEELDNDSKQSILDSRKRGEEGGYNHHNHLDGVDIDDIVNAYESDNAPAHNFHVMDFLETNDIVPNVFPGAGKNTEKHSARIVKLENGPDRRTAGGGNYRKVTWHTRHEPDRANPTKLPTRTYTTWDDQGNKVSERKEPITHKTVPVKNKYVPKTSTLVHEIGHTFEPWRGYNVRTERVRRRQGDVTTDPIAEGYADAHTDRTYYHRGQFESVLHDSDVRAKQIKTSGYSSEYGNWNATERALYSAVRQHLATNPGDDLAIPDRQKLLDHYQIREDVIAAQNHELARQRRNVRRRSNRTYRYGGHAPTNLDEHYDVHLANKLALGQMWETLPELRPVLHKLGFGRTASAAHKDYMSRTASQKPLLDSAVRNRRRNELQTAEQLSLIPTKTQRKRN